MSLRVAQLAPPFESVPPRLYGGTERVVAWLVDELVAQGHDVTLFASADSRTSAQRLVPICPEALRLRPDLGAAAAFETLELDELVDLADEFDIIHNHLEYLPFPLARLLGVPMVTTLHGRLDLPELDPIFRRFVEQPLVSISDAQRRPHPDVNWVRTVHHGLPPDTYHDEHDGRGGYLAFLGRISREKRLDLAIDVAVATGLPLKIAAKLDVADHGYFEREIRHRMAHPLVEFVGEIGELDKCAFLGAARTLLFPIDWPEPFGLVMIEAMACGTPVVARRCGSVPEVLEDGVTGYLCDTLDDLVAGVERVGRLDRRRIRERFEARFSAARMAADYVDAYHQVLAESPLVPEVTLDA